MRTCSRPVKPEDPRDFVALYEYDMTRIIWIKTGNVECPLRAADDKTVYGGEKVYCDYPNTREELARFSGEEPKCSQDHCAVLEFLNAMTFLALLALCAKAKETTA